MERDEVIKIFNDLITGERREIEFSKGYRIFEEIYNYVEDFIAGVITREQFWVLAKFKYPTHQICFSTEASLRCLSFVESERISKK